MRWFFKRHLDPATRIGEVLFGLIMALGLTGAVRLSMETTSNRELLLAILGCNLAWGVVDGVMYAMLALFERGRKARVVRSVLSAPTEDAALQRIAMEYGERLELFTTADERATIYRSMLEIARRSGHEPPQLVRDDLLGGIAVGLIILVATLPILLPFLIFSNTTVAVRFSNLIAIGMLFGLGRQWGQTVGANPIRIGMGITCVGVVLVLITIVLGG